MIDDDQLADWQRLADAATPGPCKVEDYAASGAAIAIKDSKCEWISIGTMKLPDAKLYQAAMPALLAEVARLQAENVTLRTALRSGAGHTHSADALADGWHPADREAYENQLADEHNEHMRSEGYE